METEFLKPRLVGARFSEHSIPVEVLKDWAAFESLIVEAARWLYLEENPKRKRTPRGFAQSFSLNLKNITEGSAVAVLDRCSVGGGGHFDDGVDWFDKARDRVLSTIHAASEGKSLEGFLPKALLAYFDQFGRSLKDDESIEFTRGLGQSTVVYNHHVRKILVLKSATEYRTEEAVRGSMSELNLENRTFMLRLVSGERVVGHYSDELRQAALSALSAYGESMVMVEGAVVRDQSDTRKRIEQVTRIEPLDPLDVPARIEALALLPDGWFDGKGVRLSADGLSWLAKIWTKHWPEDLPLPYAYPTPEGLVQFEWSFTSRSVSLEVNLTSKSAELVISCNENGELLEEINCNLEDSDAWDVLTNSFRQITT